MSERKFPVLQVVLNHACWLPTDQLFFIIIIIIIIIVIIIFILIIIILIIIIIKLLLLLLLLLLLHLNSLKKSHGLTLVLWMAHAPQVTKYMS